MRAAISLVVSPASGGKARRMAKSRSSCGAAGAWLTVREARANNLRDVDAKFPIGLLTCVTGVSGSGKSTLVNDVLAAAAARKLNGAKTIPGKHRQIENLDFFEKLVQVDQEPIGRSPRSNPASYVDLLTLLRDLYAQVPLAKIRGYKASRFSLASCTATTVSTGLRNRRACTEKSYMLHHFKIPLCPPRHRFGTLTPIFALQQSWSTFGMRHEAWVESGAVTSRDGCGVVQFSLLFRSKS